MKSVRFSVCTFMFLEGIVGAYTKYWKSNLGTAGAQCFRVRVDNGELFVFQHQVVLTNTNLTRVISLLYQLW